MEIDILEENDRVSEILNEIYLETVERSTLTWIIPLKDEE